MICTGWPSAWDARARKPCLPRARRSALVPATRTALACMSEMRCPNRWRHASARWVTSFRRRPSSRRPAASCTGSRRRSMTTSWPSRYCATTRWKLLEPRSTAASTSGTRCTRRLKGSTAPGSRSGRERGAAAAGGVRVGVADDELRAFQTLAVVDLRAVEVLEAHGIDQQLDAQLLDRGVAFLRGLVELEAVLHARTAAALHIDPQHQRRIALVADQLGHLARGGVGTLDEFVHIFTILPLMAAP